MAFWNRKKMLVLIKTFLENNNATYTVSNNEVSFEIHFNKNDFTIYPYLKVNEENGTLILNINIKEVNSLTTEILHKINNFNAKSVYFKAFVNDDNILYLEYNTFANADNIINVLQGVIDSLFSLSDLIDEL